jgi:hypothetical protein
MNENSPPPSIEQERLKLDHERLKLDTSFARKWFPTLVTLVVGFIAAIFGYVQHLSTKEVTEKAQIEATAKNEREWGFKVVEMYFSNRELFDFTKNPHQAADNLRVLSAVAPKVVQGLLNAELSRIPSPESQDETKDAQRLESLAAVAQVQDALKSAKGAAAEPTDGMKAEDFTVYIQYAAGSQAAALKAQETLESWGYRAPGIDQVGKVPSQLQVRYYRPDQEKIAKALLDRIGDALGLTANADNAVRVVSKRQLPSGILELWIPEE